MPEPAAKVEHIIECPEPKVRAHFFDLEYAVAKQPYHGARLSWVAGPDGARCVRKSINVLGRAVWHDYVVEDVGGAWTKRVIAGDNVGAYYVAHFDPIAPDSTRVSFEAFPPPGGFTSALGRLSRLGLEKEMKKLLTDHQKALGDYDVARPAKTAAERFTKIEDLAGIARAKQGRERQALVATILEAAALVAIADGTADDAESGVFDRVAQLLAEQEMDADGRARLVHGATRASYEHGIAERCAHVGQRLGALGAGPLGLAVAALVADASHGMDKRELAALRAIADGAKVSEEDLVLLLDR